MIRFDCKRKGLQERSVNLKKVKKSYFYPKLKGKRNELGFSLEDMANHLGISIDCYFRKEKGKTDFYLCEVRKILNLFNEKFENIFFVNSVNETVDKDNDV